MKASDLLVKCLENENVEYIFGIPGEETLDLMESLRNSTIRYVLTRHEQAAAFMVLGQSMESSAGDPTQAGKIKNEFFYDPFIAGDRSEHANLFYDILTSNARINCYLLNTGWVGEGRSYKDITLRDTMGILDSLLRGGAEDWHLSHKTGLVIPRSIRAVDSILMRPEKLLSAQEFDSRQRALNRQRAEFMDNYPNLDPKIKAVFQTRAVAVGQVG